jgi:trigger factor
MVHVEVQAKGEITRLLHVSVSSEEVEHQFAQVTHKIQKGAALPGFRKGKAPLDLITHKYSHEIREEVLERLVSRSYQQALTQTKSVPIDQPRFENLVLDRDKPLTYQVTVDVLPQVKLPAYTGLKLKRKATRVEDKQVQEVLERLLQQNAPLEPVTDRPSREGDEVTIDFIGTRDGAPVPGAAGEGVAVELGAHQTIPDFERNLYGLEPQGQKTFSAKFPDDYADQELAGRSVDFAVTVKAVRMRRPGTLDDDFAKSLGPFTSLEELKERVRQDLTAEQERQDRMLLRDQVLQQLSKSVQVSIPDLLINRSLDRLAADQEKRLQERQQTWEQSGTTREDYKKQQRGAVEFQWRANLALREIALHENLEVGQAEVEAEVERLARLSRQTPQTIVDYLNRTHGWDEVYDRLRFDKTLDWLIAHAQVAEG